MHTHQKTSHFLFSLSMSLRSITKYHTRGNMIFIHGNLLLVNCLSDRVKQKNYLNCTLQEEGKNLIHWIDRKCKLSERIRCKKLNLLGRPRSPTHLLNAYAFLFKLFLLRRITNCTCLRQTETKPSKIRYLIIYINLVLNKYAYTTFIKDVVM